MKSSLQSQLSDILTCSVSDVDETYDRVLELFRRRAKVGVMTFFRAAAIDGTHHYDDIRNSNADDSLRHALDGREGEPILDGPTLNISSPAANDVNEFKNIDIDAQFRNSTVDDKLLSPFEIHSASRIMVYHGDRFVGWLGCFRRGDKPECDTALRKHLAPLRKPICATLSTVDALHRDRLVDEKGFATFTPDGTLQHSSRIAWEFLNDDRQRYIAQLVRQIDGGNPDPCCRVVAGMEVRLTRLRGSGMSRYLAQISPPASVTIDPLSRLTTAQREVVEFAVAGATNSEIAEATDRSPATVKVHLRNVYERLGISSRVELVRMVGRNR